MNILLVSARRSAYTGESITAPHQGVLSLAASLKAATFSDTSGVNVSILDEQLIFLENSHQVSYEWLNSYEPDIIGVQTTTSSLKNAIKLLEEARQRFPSALRVIGGVGVATIARKLISDDAVDVAVEGEAEIVFSNLVSNYGNYARERLKEVRGIVFKDKDGKVISNAPQSPIKCLDILPMPARDLVDMQKYRNISKGRAGNLITSRGCSYVCAYCYSKHQWGVGQRHFSLNRTLTEIQTLVEVYGINRIRIEDDDFLEDREWVQSFCHELLNRNIQIEWEAKARPDHIVLDEDLIRLMEKSGCFRLLVGVETMDPALLVRLRRPLRIEITAKALEILGKNGIAVQATLILGIPGESDKAMRYTLEWLEKRLTREHDISSPCFFVPFYQNIVDAMRQNLEFTVIEKDTDCYTGHVPITASPACSFEELLNLYDDMKPTRRGIYERIAHLAPADEIYQRLNASGSE